MLNTLTACCLREDLDHGSDHYPIETSSLFSPHVTSHVSKPLWRNADKTALCLRAKELGLPASNYENCYDKGVGVDRLLRWIKEAVAQHIPLSKSVSFSVPWWSSELTQLMTNARRARRCTKGSHVLKLGESTWRHSMLKGRQSGKQKPCISSRLWPRLQEGEEAYSH